MAEFTRGELQTAETDQLMLIVKTLEIIVVMKMLLVRRKMATLQLVTIVM